MQSLAGGRCVSVASASAKGSLNRRLPKLVHSSGSQAGARKPRLAHPPAAAAAASMQAPDFSTASAAADVAALLQLPFPPVQPLIGCEGGSFAQETITTRLPAIMDTVLADLALQASEAGVDAADVAAAVAAFKTMQAEMPVDGHLTPLEVPPSLPATHVLRSIIPTTNAAVAAWQQHMATAPWLQQLSSGSSSSGGAAASWLQLPWLVVECYLYVRLATIMAAQPSLVSYDPFFRQKGGALIKSMTAAADIAVSLQQLLEQQQQQQQQAAAGGGGGSDRQQQRREVLLGPEGKERVYQLFQYALWGNKTDLSMLVDVAHMDSAALGFNTTTSSSSSSSSSNIIVDEFDQLWTYLSSKAQQQQQQHQQQEGSLLPRVDVILDNAGLELYTDLVLADYLVTSGLAGTVVLHGKQLPWFVSDTLHHDLHHLINTCSSSSSSSSGGGGGGDSAAAVAAVAARWQQHLQSGRWSFKADAFWTTPHPFWWMKQLAPELHGDLSNSCLLIFKGDLNYRKLAGDCRWSPTTPFSTALCGFFPAPLVSLRTLKADVIAGLAPGEAEQLDKLDPKWQVNGKFGVVQFAATA